ncbi:unnamed protein product, partial [marine sediment metagenome]
LSDRNNGKRLTTQSIRKIVKKHLRDIGIDSKRLSALILFLARAIES